MITASHCTIGQIAVLWLMTFVVGIGHFSNCIASSREIISAVFAGSVSFVRYMYWLALATSDILGGVLIVALLNFGQVQEGKA